MRQVANKKEEFRIGKPSPIVRDGETCSPSRVFRGRGLSAEQQQAWTEKILELRNYACGQYDACTDFAAEHNWQSFVCVNCPKCRQEKT